MAGSGFGTPTPGEYTNNQPYSGVPAGGFTPDAWRAWDGKGSGPGDKGPGDKGPGNKTDPGGNRYYGGGGGGGGVGDSKVYINYYTRILGISANKALVAQAVKGNYTMQEFQLLVQRKDTFRFLKTAQGQEVVSNFRELWGRIFPSLDAQPGKQALLAYLRQTPTKDWRVPTNPSSLRDMYAFLSRTKRFKAIYGDFAGTKFERNLDFMGYRDYKDRFQNILKQYKVYGIDDTTGQQGKQAARDQVSYFFDSDISPEDFEKNLQLVLGGKDAYAWAEGGQLGGKQAKEAMFNRAGSMGTLQKIAGALEAQKNYMSGRQAEYQVQRNEFGRAEQQAIY